MEKTRKRKGASFGINANSDDESAKAQQSVSVDLSDILDQAQKIAQAGKYKKVQRTTRMCTQCGSTEKNIHECGGDKNSSGGWSEEWAEENVIVVLTDDDGNLMRDEYGDVIRA